MQKREVAGLGAHDGMPKLPADWEYITLSDLALSERGITYGIVQPGKHQADGIPIVRVNDIRFGRINPSQPLRVAPHIVAKYRRTELQGGELLLTLVGTVGESAIVPDELTGWNVARAVAVIPIVKDVGARWVHICLRMRELQHLIRTWCTTTVQATFNLRDAARLPIPIPPTKVRNAIAQILGNLDDKIELNRRMNRTLEQMSAAIFKAWFVDFEPVKAKADGAKSFPSMQQKVFDALPTEFTDSPLGPIPKGWEVVGFGDVAECFDSKRIPLSKRERAKRQGSYPYYGAASVMDYVDDFLFDGIYVLMGEDGSVITDDGHPVLQYVWGQFWANNHAHVLRGKNGISTEHLLVSLRESILTPFITGAVQLKLNQGNMRQIPFVLSAPSVSEAFARTIDPLFAKYRAGIEESKTLAAIRDALLPKLLSGEIRVGEAERIAEEVA